MPVKNQKKLHQIQFAAVDAVQPLAEQFDALAIFKSFE
jgi:hypothetical protein